MATRSGAQPGVATQALPRKLSTHQKAVLIQVLRVFTEQEVRVCYRPDVADAQALAEDFLVVFKAVGWEAREVEPAPDGVRDAKGLALLVRKEDETPHAALALRDALLIYHLEAHFLCDPGSVKPGSFALIIGAHR